MQIEGSKRFVVLWINGKYRCPMIPGFIRQVVLATPLCQRELSLKTVADGHKPLAIFGLQRIRRRAALCLLHAYPLLVDLNLPELPTRQLVLRIISDRVVK